MDAVRSQMRMRSSTPPRLPRCRIADDKVALTFATAAAFARGELASTTTRRRPNRSACPAARRPRWCIRATCRAAASAA
jgi:hypothetical protein